MRFERDAVLSKNVTQLKTDISEIRNLNNHGASGAFLEDTLSKIFELVVRQNVKLQTVISNNLYHNRYGYQKTD